jgi:hypothetical protein
MVGLMKILISCLDDWCDYIISTSPYYDTQGRLGRVLRHTVTKPIKQQALGELSSSRVGRFAE